MKLNKDTQILIVGLGLLGGSYAKKLKQLGFTVNAITRSQSSVDYALENGLADNATTEIDADMIARSKLVVFALYPHVFVEWIKENQRFFSPGTVITDVTGVKECIVYKIQGMLRDDVEFIAAHPMAGREVSGVQNSDERIFRNANYIVVPTDKNSEEAVELCRELGRTLGFKNVSTLSPEEHDRMIAFLSQLTHCIAVSLMCANDQDGFEQYTGDSFRDLTRIANINDEMWSELFLLNRDALLDEMDRFEKSFNRLRDTIKNSDREEMREIMRCSAQRRRAFDK